MKKIVIIGAGPAGLTAGVEILRKNSQYQVVILEESGFMGGISKTVNCDGNRMDMGGHRFFTKNNRVMDWWKDMLPADFLVRKRVSHIYYRKHFFDYPVKMNFITIKNLGLVTMLQAGFSYLKSCVRKRKENSLEDFYINRFGKKLYSIFFEGYTEKLWGRHPSQISPDWGAQRVKGLSVSAVIKDMFGKVLHGRKRDVETSLIETFYYPKYGPGQMWEAAAETFKSLGGEIWCGCKVTGLTQADGRISRVSYEQDGETKYLEPDTVFSGMAVKDLVAAMNDVPERIGKIASGLPYRDFVTVGLLVDKASVKKVSYGKKNSGKKRKTALLPDCWIYVQERAVKMGRIQIFNNWSPYLVKDAENTVFLGLEYFCEEGDAMWNMSPEEWRNFGRKELIQMGILSSGAKVRLSHCEKVKKAYPAYFDTYAEMPKLRRWLDGIGNLYCIGRNGQHRYNNMDHSMLTAMTAVDCLFDEKKDRKAIWQVNTEKEYHEEG